MKEARILSMVFSIIIAGVTFAKIQNSDQYYFLVSAPLSNWERVNDDNDPDSFNWNVFNAENQTKYFFMNVKQVHDMGIPIHIGISEAPDWMYSVVEKKNINNMKSNLNNELTECVCAFLLVLKSKYNVDVQSVVIGDVRSNGQSLFKIDNSKGDFERKIRKRFKALGIDTDINVVENSEDPYQDQSAKIPTKFSLEHNYPNPFNPETTISYQLSGGSQVKIDIFDILGRKVRTLVNQKQEAGYYNILWDGKNDDGNRVASGLYLYNIRAKSKANNFVSTKKMILLK